jgi:hypothetical protein
MTTKKYFIEILKIKCFILAQNTLGANFSFLTFKGEGCGRDTNFISRRRGTDGIFAQIMYILGIKSS